MSLVYKIASTSMEMEQIHRLNYMTFVEEIPQHAPNDTGKRVDRFHNENIYLIGKKREKLVAMLAIRNQRPFSLDEKLPPLDAYLPFVPQHMVEIRLLSVEKEHRTGQVFYGLAKYLKRYLWDNNVELAIMSGTTRQLKLYRRLGFIPFAHLVGNKDAVFQPMYMTKQSFESSDAAKLFEPPASQTEPVTFYAGPVPIEEDVANVMKQQPLSHRSSAFMDTMSNVQMLLKEMTQANHVKVLLGSGTLANDAIAGQLSLLDGRGLILVNGEFGHRLVDHAERMELKFDVLEETWGKPFSFEDIEPYMREGSYSWLWVVHGETSTGMLNDVEGIQQLCHAYQIKLCLDCVSSIGAVRVNLAHVYLASGVSGKAIGGYTGLTFVFHQEELEPSSKLPRYLDLGMYAAKNSVPFSHSSNLLDACSQALQKYCTDDPYERLIEVYELLITELQRAGLTTMTEKKHAAPFIVTIPLAKPLSSQTIGDTLAKEGFFVQYESDYLLHNNVFQIATIGITAANVLDLIRCLEACLSS
ncbi:aminotransferase class V-fold PLP-dependent enzyme [Paenibacillus eucommiae]|uniref:Aspartate aminotransferase-like enzyme n=1 Tax=Paenibacillus eucommiae TaxID=1355755 RepID=A0ABS4INJ8_9BACL|nr:aminotransferase class V-fold PLP-dependent enzyme [Paenibacillus eucommiae]MBP1989132.1 aspartate aminotransferase-like enzyme [Paenibacillus eucommiae]